MIKAVFFDIDGTLLSHKTYSVPDSTVRALEQLREKGVLYFIATGRHLPELKKLQPLQGLRFDGYVTLNGQYCCNDTGVIYHCPIRHSDVAALLDFLKAEPHPCILVETDRMYINFHNDHVARVQAAIHTDLPPLGDLDRGYTEPIYQAILYMNKASLDRLPELPGIKLTFWNMGGADLIPKNGGKSTGIAQILAHYGIERSETIAFGDGHNDVDMFGAVGTAVAMGNACRAAKEAAHYITDPVDEDGIWNALKHFGIF